MTEWNAVILAGGRARRLHGIDKTALLFDGATLLDHARAAACDARAIAVVGGDSGIAEAPRFAGPAAATIAGLATMPQARYTAVLAADLPLVASALPLLLDALTGAGGVIAVDEQGRRQPLLAVYDTVELAQAGIGRVLTGMSMSALIEGLTLAEVQLPAGLCADVDTPDDARALGIRLEGLAHVGA